MDGRDCFLLTEAVKEGQDAGPVPQYVLTAAHQLSVNAGQLCFVSLPPSLGHPLYHSVEDCALLPLPGVPMACCAGQ